MAVLIHGMEMPKSCIDCQICRDYQCELTGKYPFDENDDDADILTIGYTVRPDWCPLEEVTLVTGMYKTQRKENVNGYLR